MRRIDVERWSRREHFRLLRSWSNPYFTLTANVDLTAFYPAVKRRGASFNTAIVYVVTRAANAVPEFRQRIRGDEVVEHDVVQPGTTILRDDDTFTFCYFRYDEDFRRFAAHAAECVAHVLENPTLDNPPGRDDLLFMTSIPWVSFTQLSHAIDLKEPDSIPRLAWGKYFRDGERLLMPLGVMANHALVDGLHAGRFYQAAQELFDDPEETLGPA